MIATKEQKKIMALIAGATFILGIIVVIPFKTIFTSPNILLIELIIKLGFVPLFILLLSIYPNVLKYRQVERYREQSKMVSVMSYLPISFYIGSLLVNGLYSLSRGVAPLGLVTWDIWFVIFLMTMLLLVCISHVFVRFEMKLSKKEHFILDACLLVITLCFMIMNGQVTSAYHEYFISVGATGSLGLLIMYLGTLVVLIVHVNGVIKLLRNDEIYLNIKLDELDDSTPKTESAEYVRAYNDILDDFESYLEEAEEIEIDEDNFEEPVAEELVEEEPVAEEAAVEPVKEVKPEPIKKPVVIVEHVKEEVLVPVDEAEKAEVEQEKAALEAEKNALLEEKEKLANEEAELEEMRKDFANKEAMIAAAVVNVKEEKPKVPKQPKEIKPSYKAVTSYARRLKDVVSVENEKQTNCRFLIGKKPFLISSNTNNDYRLTFYADMSKLVGWIVNAPSIIKAKSPKGENWFKLVNKGNISEDVLYDIIKSSHDLLLEQEKERLEKKNAKSSKE